MRVTDCTRNDKHACDRVQRISHSSIRFTRAISNLFLRIFYGYPLSMTPRPFFHDFVCGQTLAVKELRLTQNYWQEVNFVCFCTSSQKVSHKKF